MKVFISWSGPKSKQIAKLIYDWLPIVLQNVEPYMSSEEIEKGTRWATNVATELQSCNFGLLCLTPDNLNVPWIHFEAGALAKVIDRSRVAPLLLFDLKPSDVQGPLTQFQAVIFEKDDMKSLLKSINKVAGDDDKVLDENRLEKAFSGLWGQLYEDIKAIQEIKRDHTPDITPLQSRDDVRPILEEILVISRHQQSIANSEYVEVLVKKLLREQTTELNNLMREYYVESDDNHFVTHDLSVCWSVFLDAWTNFNASPKLVESGMVEQVEMRALLDSIIGLRRPIDFLLDRRPPRRGLRRVIGETVVRRGPTGPPNVVSGPTGSPQPRREYASSITLRERGPKPTE